MPTYKEGHLFILGSGPAPPDTLPDAPPKHWFELHVLPAGLRLVHFPEECDYENIVEDLNEDEFRAEPWAIPGEAGSARGLVIAAKTKKYYLRTGPAPSADSDEKWWTGHRRDCAEWLTRLGYEPPEEGEPPKEPEPEEEEEAEEEPEEPLWKREGRKRGRLLVVASCPELGTRDLQIGDDTRFQEEVMTHLLRLRDGERIHVAFDRAGTTTSSPEDTMMFEIASLWNRSGKKHWDTVIKATKWFHAYQQMVKMGLLQIQTQNPECALEVLCLHGGPITQAEQAQMPNILEGARADCEAKGIKLVAEQRNVSYADFHNVVLPEHSLECLVEVEGGDPTASEMGLTIHWCSAGAVLPAIGTMTSLTTLDLDENQIQDVSPLASLTSLTSLDLRRNQIVDRSPLQDLSKSCTIYW